MDEPVASIEKRLRDASSKSTERALTPEIIPSKPPPSVVSPDHEPDIQQYPPRRDRPLSRAATSIYLFIAIIIAVILAILIGFIMRMRSKPYTKREVMYASFLGSLLLRALRCLAVPFFVLSIISALGRLNVTSSIKITLQTLIYFLTTTLVAVLIACFLTAGIHPGQRNEVDVIDEIPFPERTIVDYFLDLIKNLVPPNIIEACIFMHVTKIQKIFNGINVSIEEWDFDPEVLHPTTNYVGLVIVALIIGFTIAYIGWSVAICLHVTDALADIFLEITLWLLIISPLGIFCLVLGQVLALGDVRSDFLQVGLYALTVILGVLIHSCLVLPLLYLIFVRKSPFKFAYHCLQIMTTALGTSSSIVTMPVTILTLEEKSKMDPRITRFIIPFGTTINMDGAAIYVVVAPLFLAQRRFLTTGLSHYLAVCATANLASLGVVGLPQGAILAILIVMNILELPPEDVGLILTVDWILDRLVTVTDVWSDCVGAAIIQRRSKKLLEKL